MNINDDTTPLRNDDYISEMASDSPELSLCDDHELNCSSHESYSKIEPTHILSEIKNKNGERLIIGHLNINSLQNKFEPLKSIIQQNVDIIMISETKLDDSFPSNQFVLEGFSSPFRLDKNCRSGGIVIYIREDIPCKELKKHDLPKDVEGIYIELVLRNNKWILFGGYNPKKENATYFFNHVGKGLDKFLGKYDNMLLLGDFNADKYNVALNDFCETYNLSNLITEPTCYKNPDNPSSIDVMLTNRKRNFCNSITIETGLSDYHKLTISVLKTYFKKKPPVRLNYRKYSTFNENSFRHDLLENLQNLPKESLNYDTFHDIFVTTLDKHAPIKQKFVRGNNAPFMNKTLSKAFMTRSKLKNNYNRNPSLDNRKKYTSYRNYCVKLLRKEKRDYYNNLDLKLLENNRIFWKRIKPLFSNKQISIKNTIILIDKDDAISDSEEVAEKLNSFFTDAIENLGIEHLSQMEINELSQENIDVILKTYELHPSVLKIKEHITVDNSFSFAETSLQIIQNEIIEINTKKSVKENDIPTKILARSADIVSEFLAEIYNSSINHNDFPQSLKLADVKPIHKKDERTLMNNYRPISLLPSVSKIFERNMYTQILSYIERFLSPYLFGFRKGHSTEQCLMVMLEFWKKALDKNKYAAAILTDLSKAFDCLNHELLIAKLHAYGFDINALKFLYSYLKKRKQRTKVDSSFSSWKEVKFGVPQGSILGPLLFNIFINDIFYFTQKTSIANYADDNTPYVTGNNLNDMLEILSSETSILFEWFRINEMKSNSDKCHLLVGKKDKISITVGDEVINSSPSVDLLGVTIDNNLHFNEHVSRLCKKGNKKLHALARIAPFLNTEKRKMMMNTFIQSQFNYCPLIWMFHSRSLNNKINRLHERALRVVYNNGNASFSELLEIANGFTIHHRNLQKLATEVFKIKNNLSPLPLQELFNQHDSPYNLRKKKLWETGNVRTVHYGTETFSYLGPKIWDLLPNKIKESTTLYEFKQKIKKWKPEHCPCRLCKTFIPKLGFIN